MGNSDERGLSLEDLLGIHLVAHEIWLKFSLSDLLQVSRVNKQWYSRSRRYLEGKFCCINLSANPCASLKTVNDFLETVTHPIYNGIRHERKLYGTALWTNKYYRPYSCNDDCLLRQDGENLNVREIYSNVFNKLKFNFVAFRGLRNEDCPFMKFIRLVLTERAHEIKELHFTGLLFDRGSVNLRRHWGISNPDNWFPNLVTLKIPKHDMDLSLELIESAPNLNKIIGSFDNYSYEDWRDPDRYVPANKHFAISNATAIGAAHISHLVTEVKPKNLETICLIATPRQNRDNSHIENCVLKLSNLMCHSLRKISCSFSTLALLGNISGIPRFYVLKSMDLFNDYGQASFKKGLGYLKSITFKYTFPNVREVAIHDGICFKPPLMYEPVQDFCCASVTSMQLGQCNLDCIPVISSIFPNVTRLQLHTIGVLQHLLQLNSDWGNLEELDFCYSLDNIRLDQYFRPCESSSSQNDLRRIQNVDNNLEIHAHTKGYSFFNRKHLKKISIIGSPSWFLPNHVRKLMGPDFLSLETGRSITQNLPGLLIELKVELNESVHSSDDFNFSHLMTIADISQSSSDVKQGNLSENLLRTWSIRFRSASHS